MLRIYLIWLVVINLITMILYIIDKIKAIYHKWRISEAMLLTLTFIGGGLGAFFGLFLFRHKNRHWYFVGITIISLIWQIALLVMLMI